MFLFLPTTQHNPVLCESECLIRWRCQVSVLFKHLEIPATDGAFVPIISIASPILAPPSILPPPKCFLKNILWLAFHQPGLTFTCNFKTVNDLRTAVQLMIDWLHITCWYWSDNNVERGLWSNPSDDWRDNAVQRAYQHDLTHHNPCNNVTLGTIWASCQPVYYIYDL